MNISDKRPQKKKDGAKYDKELLSAIIINMVRREVNKTKKDKLPYIPISKQTYKEYIKQKNKKRS